MSCILWDIYSRVSGGFLSIFVPSCLFRNRFFVLFLTILAQILKLRCHFTEYLTCFTHEMTIDRDRTFSHPSQDNPVDTLF